VETGVTVTVLYITVGTQVEMVMVLKRGAGLEAATGAEDGTPAAAEVGTVGAAALELLT
jgi:hypothetical protein